MPIDALNRALTDFLHTSLRNARVGLEASGLCAALLLRGPVGIGTIVFTFTVGALISFFKDRFAFWDWMDANDIQCRVRDSLCFSINIL